VKLGDTLGDLKDKILVDMLAVMLPKRKPGS